MRTSTGGCVCGAVRYEALGDPSTSMICHCRTCRRAAGSPLVAWVTFEKPAFRLTRGKPREFHSSPGVRRTFCAACGTPLTYQTAESPATIDVTTCSLDEPGAFPPRYHSWLRHRVSWMALGDDLPRFEEARTRS